MAKSQGLLAVAERQAIKEGTLRRASIEPIGKKMHIGAQLASMRFED